MKARELLSMLKQYPDAPVGVTAGDDYENKKYRLSVYCSADDEVIIEYWD